MPPIVRYSSSLGEESITERPTPAKRTVASSEKSETNSGSGGSGGRDEALVDPCGMGEA